MRGELLRALCASAVVIVVGACSTAPAGGVHFGDASTVSAPTSVGTAPMFAVSPLGTQAVAWVSAPSGGTDGRLYVSVGGRAPSEIRDSLGPIEAHGEAPPKLAYGPDSALYAVYTVGKIVPGQRFPLSALRLVRSADDGATWTSPVTVTDGAVFGSHSFHALHVAGDGTIYVSWLGGPEGGAPAAPMMMSMASMKHDTAKADGHGGHGMHAASASWITRSTDGGRTWLPRTRVDMGEACPCCRTSLASTNDGTLYMAWRHVYPGNIRDVVVARSSDHGSTWSEPVRVHADDWQFDACPHAGPAIAVGANGTLHVTWWTGKEGNAGVFYAQSTDGAKTFGTTTALGAAQYSRPAHVQLSLASNNRVVVAWDDGTKDIPQVVVRVSKDGGAHFADAVPLSVAGRAASFPVLGVSGSGDSLAVVWSEESADAARAAAAKSPNMKDPKSVKGLEAVGEAQVMVRRGVLR